MARIRHSNTTCIIRTTCLSPKWANSTTAQTCTLEYENGRHNMDSGNLRSHRLSTHIVCFVSCTGAYLSNRHSTPVDKEAAIVDVSSRRVVWDWLGKVLTVVGLQESAGRVCIVEHVFLDSCHSLLVTG